jgi:ribosomal protein L7/L12
LKKLSNYRQAIWMIPLTILWLGKSITEETSNRWFYIALFVLSLLSLVANIWGQYKDKSNKIKMPEILFDNINDEIESLVSQGKKIEAIKKYRMFTGVGLKEAKDYIDGVETPKADVATMDEELRSLISAGKKIQAIKKCRMITGLGLKEAKDYVDNLN